MPHATPRTALTPSPLLTLGGAGLQQPSFSLSSQPCELAHAPPQRFVFDRYMGKYCATAVGAGFCLQEAFVAAAPAAPVGRATPTNPQLTLNSQALSIPTRPRVHFHFSASHSTSPQTHTPIFPPPSSCQPSPCRRVRLPAVRWRASSVAQSRVQRLRRASALDVRCRVTRLPPRVARRPLPRLLQCAQHLWRVELPRAAGGQHAAVPGRRHPRRPLLPLE